MMFINLFCCVILSRCVTTTELSTLRLSLFKGSCIRSTMIYVILKKYLWTKGVLKGQCDALNCRALAFAYRTRQLPVTVQKGRIWSQTCRWQ